MGILIKKYAIAGDFMKMFHYVTLTTLSALILLWAGLLLDTNNILSHLSEMMHLLERLLK